MGSVKEANLRAKNESESSGQSHLSGATTVAMFQDLVTGSLRDLQASHQRELAVLHEENLRLLDKLADRGKAAGKSLAGVVEVATKVPRIPCITGVLEVANKVPRISPTTKPRPVVDST